MDAPKEVFLKDYKKPDYLFDSVHMNIVMLLLENIQSHISGSPYYCRQLIFVM